MTCADCGTELSPNALVCPACRSLVHAAELRTLAAKAESATAKGQVQEARAAWDAALALLPTDSQQYAVITGKAQALATRAADAADAAQAGAAAAGGSWWKQWSAGIVAVVILLVTKGKFLLLGITKLPTLLSMFGFFGVYWAAFGWPLALGLVLTIYVHEMGHVAAIVRLGMKPTAPMFIPGLGAFVSYSKRITDPREDAYVGLAGPIWGAGAGLVCFAVATWTGNTTWMAIAQLTGFINLFNLLPVFGLDGSHGFKALNGWQRLAVAAAMGLAAWLLAVKLLYLVAIVALVRVFTRDHGPGDARTFAHFLGLTAFLAWLASQRALSI